MTCRYACRPPKAAFVDKAPLGPATAQPVARGRSRIPDVRLDRHRPSSALNAAGVRHPWAMLRSLWTAWVGHPIG
jgi:hypothetical protein